MMMKFYSVFDICIDYSLSFVKVSITITVNIPCFKQTTVNIPLKTY